MSQANSVTGFHYRLIDTSDFALLCKATSTSDKELKA